MLLTRLLDLEDKNDARTKPNPCAVSIRRRSESRSRDAFGLSANRLCISAASEIATYDGVLLVRTAP